MSDVRISNGSPTLERMEGRQAEHPKPSACRSLFGPVDHEELSRDLQKHRQELEEACQRKWNFDFQLHRPLRGRFEWRALEPGASPDFYSRPTRLPKGKGAGDTRCAPRAACADPAAGQRKRPAPDDSSPQNKRANTAEEEVSEDSHSASTVEQTPKKSSPRQHQT
ncbi:cyclin-dependent kinase inhibitor 1B [Alligator mississippiensis]|uniref:cyclin-dependent kinase inhibitor 1B n=1 Tax=Alligator mississippiensis TaxID=8496 RepID=UPI0003D0B455|nr:cyclin-dependent kinase inhibitor 1B [Alligator mississippiensis]